MARPSVKYLVVHTAASQGVGVDADVIDHWHRENGWRKIGYHYVIIDDQHPTLPDGHVQTGRSPLETGAHIFGLNNFSLGICCVGHGDHRDFTEAQKTSLVELLAKLAKKYNVPTENIIGHSDINTLVDLGIVSDQYRTKKSCPGDKVSLAQIISRVDAAMKNLRDAPIETARKTIRNPTTAQRLRAGIRLVERYVGQTPNAADSWNQFRNHPEVTDLLNEGDDQ